MTTGDDLPIDILGRVRSPYAQKFGIPRQAVLATNVGGRIEIHPPWDREEAFRGIERFSHLWIVFRFHAIAPPAGDGFQTMVRPPRLGGRQKVGIFASRSGHRPNRLGLSVVRNVGLKRNECGLSLQIADHDLLDGTPVVDIKPYLPYADSIGTATAGYSVEPVADFDQITFTDDAREQLEKWSARNNIDLEAILRQLLQFDARPAYRQKPGDNRECRLRLYDLDVHYRIDDTTLRVLSLQSLKPENK